MWQLRIWKRCKKFDTLKKLKFKQKLFYVLAAQTEMGNYNPDVCIILLSNINIVFKKIKALKKCSVALFVLKGTNILLK